MDLPDESSPSPRLETWVRSLRTPCRGCDSQIDGSSRWDVDLRSVGVEEPSAPVAVEGVRQAGEQCSAAPTSWPESPARAQVWPSATGLGVLRMPNESRRGS